MLATDGVFTGALSAFTLVATPTAVLVVNDGPTRDLGSLKLGDVAPCKIRGTNRCRCTRD